MKKYNYILVGAGLYSAVFAYLATRSGRKCLVLEKRDHVGGNVYCENVEGIHVHKYKYLKELTSLGIVTFSDWMRYAKCAILHKA